MNGDPVEIRDARWGKSEFEYNDDGRIAGAQKERGKSESFEYNAAGDIAKRVLEYAGGGFGQRNREYGEDGRLARAGQTEYQWDADGRLAEKVEGKLRWKFERSSEGRLKSVETPEGERWSYQYDAFGRRVKKTGPTGSVDYVWDGAVVAEEARGRNVTAWEFEPGTFRPLGKREKKSEFDACVTDQVGTPRELVNASGTVVWRAVFSTWGEIEEVAEKKTDCPLRFQGQWWDEESGLCYNWNRYYEPSASGYLSPDPSGLWGGTREYGYVHNPLGWIDPWGLAPRITNPDFSNNLYPAGPGQSSDVTILAQGGRGNDFTQAYQASGISKSDASGYTWHHGDFDPETGKMNMQLVDTPTHRSISHEGGVSQFEQATGTEYDTPEAKAYARKAGWNTSKPRGGCGG